MRSCLVIGGLIRLQDKTRQECRVFINSDENIESVILMNRSKWKCIKKNTEREREKEKLLFTNIGNGGKDGKGKEVTEDTENELIDSNIEGNFCNDMVASVE